MCFVSDEGILDQPHSYRSEADLAAELNDLRAKLDEIWERVSSHGVQISSRAVHSLIKARMVRLQLFEEGLFADPAWDMLLHLYAQELDHQRVAVSKLCRASAVPVATALRHMGVLEGRGLIIRRPDDFDRRRIWVELSPDGSAAMRRYFQWMLAAASKTHSV